MSWRLLRHLIAVCSLMSLTSLIELRACGIRMWVNACIRTSIRIHAHIRNEDVGRRVDRSHKGCSICIHPHL